MVGAPNPKVPFNKMLQDYQSEYRRQLDRAVVNPTPSEQTEQERYAELYKEISRGKVTDYKTEIHFANDVFKVL